MKILKVISLLLLVSCSTTTRIYSEYDLECHVVKPDWDARARICEIERMRRERF